MIESEPRFIQGIILFTGAGYTKPVLLAGARLIVAADKRAQTLYLSRRQ